MVVIIVVIILIFNTYRLTRHSHDTHTTPGCITTPTTSTTPTTQGKLTSHGTPVLHGPRGEVRDGEEIRLWQRVRLVELLLKEGQRTRRHHQSVLPERAPPRRRVYGGLHAAHEGTDVVKVTHDEGEEVCVGRAASE